MTKIVIPDIIGKKEDMRKSLSFTDKFKIVAKQGFRCSHCTITFNENVIPEFDHKNGVKSDNRIVNIQALCRICHGNKNHKDMKKKVKQRQTENNFLPKINLGR